jgi:DNA repair protein RAD5
LSLILSNREINKRKTTLIVCTLSTLQHWESEITSKIAKKTLTYYTYYGKSRLEKSVKQLQKYDIVLTTYGTLSAEFPKTKKKTAEVKAEEEEEEEETNIGTLQKTKWLRIVLDEAHSIKNSNAKVTKAVCNIDSLSRWCLTGTPVHNTLDDLYTLLHFIQVENFEDKRWWNDNIKRPTASRNATVVEKGMSRLQAILGPYVLRRTKADKVNGKPILQLPEIKISQCTKVLDPKENSFYQSIMVSAKSEFRKLLRSGNKNYLSLLETLLRVRQTCDHPYLVLQSSRDCSSFKDLNQGFDTACAESVEGKSPMKKKKIVRKDEAEEEDEEVEAGSVQVEDEDVCSGCSDILDDYYTITGCDHLFCKEVECVTINY